MGTDGSGDTFSLSEAILHEVAVHKETSPGGLNPPLYDVIDPDALNAIFRENTGHISFDYHGYNVTIDYQGT